MHITVTIGEDEQNFEFAKKQVTVGSDAVCDIVLNYEGIGDRHLKIIEKNEEFFVLDLKSGFPTRVNSKQMKPGTAIKFTSFFPVDVGGVLISLGMAETSPQILDFSDDDQIATEDNENEVGNRDKFKPNLYEGHNKTGTFKLSSAQLKKERPANLSKKVGTRKVKISSKKRRQRKLSKVETSSNKQKVSLGSVGVIGFLLIIAAFIVYKKHFSNITTTTVIPTVAVNNSNQKINPRLQLTPSDIPFLKDNHVVLESKFQRIGCQESTDLCSLVRDNRVFLEGESLQLNSQQLELFVQLTSITGLKEKFEYSEKEIAELEEFIKDNYKGIVDFEEFKNNSYVTTDPLMADKALKYMFHLMAYKLFLDSSVQQKLKDLKVDRVYIYGFEKRSNGQYQIVNYLAFGQDSLKLNQLRKSEVELKIKGVVNSNLTNGIENLIAQIGTSEFAQFDSNFAESFIAKTQLQKYEKIMKELKCNQGEVDQFCRDLKQVMLSPSDGALLKDDILWIVMDTSKAFEAYLPKYNEYYPPKEIRTVSQLYRVANQRRKLNWSQFKSKGYVDDQMTLGEMSLNMTIAIGLEHDLFTRAVEIPTAKEIAFVSHKNGKIFSVIKIPTVKAIELDTEENTTNLRYFWKSKLDLFSSQAQKLSTESILN